MVLEIKHIPDVPVNPHLVDQRRPLTKFVTMMILIKQSVSFAARSTTGQPRDKAYDQSEEQEKESHNKRTSRRDRPSGQSASHYERQDRLTASAHRSLQVRVSTAHQLAQVSSLSPFLYSLSNPSR
jgi:hypothetical protein